MAKIFRSNIHPTTYWNNSDPCHFFLRETGVNSDTILKLHHGGIKTLGQLETVTRELLISLDITNNNDMGEVLRAKYFWRERQSLCVLL